MEQKIAKELLEFIERSPSCFHAVKNMTKELEKSGYKELHEHRKWELREGGLYYVTRNRSSLIAFQIPSREFQGFQIMASHSDSPSFKIKEHPELEREKHYTVLNVEKYGGMLMAPWFDRPLSVAGRVLVQEGAGIRTALVDIGRDLLMIPSVAIHMNREANNGFSYNAQTDMLPLFGSESAKGGFWKLVAKAAGVKEEKILGADLFLYNRVKGSIWGAEEEYLSSSRLDDLQCAFASLKGFLAAKAGKSVAIHCVLDNEEVGSTTKQGAASTFLRDVLHRINSGMGRSEEAYQMALASSLMLSADNAHAVHPNHPEKADPSNRSYLNQGIVIKYHANQKYTTDGVSAALFKSICHMAEVPCQSFVNRSDMAGGSTLGNISNTQVSINTVDIGLPQLAMHSPYETAGILDTGYLIRAAASFYSKAIVSLGDGTYEIV